MKRNRSASAALGLALLLATCVGDPPLVQWGVVEVQESAAPSASSAGGEGISGASKRGAADAAGDSTLGEDATAGAGGREVQQTSGATVGFDTLQFGGGPLLNSAAKPLDVFEPVGDVGESNVEAAVEADIQMGAGVADTLGPPNPFGQGFGYQWLGHWGVTGGIGGAAQLSELPGGGAGAGAPPSFGGEARSFRDQVTNDALFDSMPPFVADRGPTPIPEPSALALLLTTLIGLGVLRSLRRLYFPKEKPLTN